MILRPEAERQGIRVSDDELAQRIMAIPALQENGRFIGEARYEALLRQQRPPLTKSQFEEQFAQRYGYDECIMVNSGSSADLLITFALTNPSVGLLKPGDEVRVLVHRAYLFNDNDSWIMENKLKDDSLYVQI